MPNRDRWVRDKSGKRLYRERVLGNRKYISDAEGHREGMVHRIPGGPTVSRDGKGHTVAKGDHPDLIHERAQRSDKDPSTYSDRLRKFAEADHRPHRAPFSGIDLPTPKPGGRNVGLAVAVLLLFGGAALWRWTEEHPVLGTAVFAGALVIIGVAVCLWLDSRRRHNRARMDAFFAQEFGDSEDEE